MYFIDKTWGKMCMIEIIYRNTVDNGLNVLVLHLKNQGMRRS